MSETPPEINPMMINDIDFKQCKLIVPHGSKSSYETAKTWKRFLNIEEFN